jgi:hypothetical protein
MLVSSINHCMCMCVYVCAYMRYVYTHLRAPTTTHTQRENSLLMLIVKDMKAYMRTQTTVTNLWSQRTSPGQPAASRNRSLALSRIRLHWLWMPWYGPLVDPQLWAWWPLLALRETLSWRLWRILEAVMCVLLICMYVCMCVCVCVGMSGDRYVCMCVCGHEW